MSGKHPGAFIHHIKPFYLLSSKKAGGLVAPLPVLERGVDHPDELAIFSPWIIKHISPTKPFDEEILTASSRGI